MIGRTNAITISGGGTTKTDYELWQEGFGYNWDSVVANAPMTNTQRILHIYTKVELLKMVSNFPTAEIYTYNGSVYRKVIMDSNKRLAFIEADYMTNSFDNLQYVCVVWGGTNLGTEVYFVNLPIVYSNTKSYRQITDGYDTRANLLWQSPSTVPFIRGIDCYKIKTITIHPTLEHVTWQTTHDKIEIQGIYGSDLQVKLLKYIIDNRPAGVTYGKIPSTYIDVTINDKALEDWLYNTMAVPQSIPPNLSWAFPTARAVTRFSFTNDLLKCGNEVFPYCNLLPNAIYLDGVIIENQTSLAMDGRHGFNNTKLTMLKNFPMWKVLDGATTGCLMPAKTARASSNFLFASMQLERSNFAIFNNGVIDNNPAKSFVANLPVLPTDINGNVLVAQTITFQDTSFKNLFTENEKAQIVSTITGKNWGLSW